MILSSLNPVDLQKVIVNEDVAVLKSIKGIGLKSAQRIIIDFSDPEKIKITDRLVGWNFLTGLIEMSLKIKILKRIH